MIIHKSGVLNIAVTPPTPCTLGLCNKKSSLRIECRKNKFKQCVVEALENVQVSRIRSRKSSSWD